MTDFNQRSIYYEASAAQRPTRRLDDASTPGNTGGTDPSVREITNFVANDTGQTTDEFGRAIPLGTFVARDFVIQTDTINQTSNATIQMENAELVFVNGFAGLGNSATTQASTMGVGAADVRWELNNTTFRATRPDGGAATQATGWGASLSTGNITGFHRNCRWIGSRNGNDTGWATWFINFQATDATFELTNPTFVLSAMNTAEPGWWVVGGSFDGTVRPLGNTFYTVRLNRRNTGASNFVALAQLDFADFIDANAFNYTNTDDVAQTALTQITGRHIQDFEDANTNAVCWLINNRYEHATLAASTNTAGRIREGYAWRPRYFQAGTTMPIDDVRVVGLLTGDGNDAGTTQATFANGGAAQAMFPFPTGNFDPVNPPGNLTVNNGLLSATIPNGVFIQVSSFTEGGNNTRLMRKALDWSTEPIYQVASAGDRHSIRAKSYASLVDQEMTTNPNLLNYTGGNAGMVDWTTNDDTEAEPDLNLNGRALNDAAIGDTAALANIDDLYPAIKRQWHSFAGEATTIAAAFRHTGVALVLSRETRANSTNANNQYLADAIDLRLAATLTTSATTQISSDSVVANFHNTAFPNGMTFNSSGTGGSIDFAGTTIGEGFTLEGRFDTVPVANFTGPAYTLNRSTAANTTISVEATAGTYEFRNVMLSGTTGTIEINSSSGAVLVVQVPSADRSLFVNGDGNVTFADLPPLPVTNTLRIPAIPGWLALRVRDLSTVDDEAVAPRRFTQAEIDSGFAEFTLSNQTSPDGPAFSNLVAGDFVEAFVKYDSTPNLNNSVVYQEQYQRIGYEATTDNAIVSFTQTQTVALTLVSAASAVTPARFVMEPVSGGAVGEVQLRNPAGDTAFNPLANGDTLSAAVQLGNFETVFQSFYNSRGTTTVPITAYGQGNISTLDGNRLTIRSGNRPGTPVFVQHIVSGWEPLVGTALFPTTGGIVEIINNSPGLAIVPVETIVAGVDASQTATNVQSAERGVGFIVADTDADGTPVLTRSRFAGIRPKRAAYNSATPYEDVLE